MSLSSQYVLERDVYTGALLLGLVQLRGFPTDYRREPYGLERPRSPPVFFYLDPGYCSGKFRRAGRSSSQQPCRLARDARLRVCIPECKTISAFQHAMAVHPSSIVARYQYRCVHAPQTPIWVIQGPSAVRAGVVPRLTGLPRNRHHPSRSFSSSPAPDGTFSQTRAMRSYCPPPPLAAPSILFWSRGKKSTKKTAPRQGHPASPIIAIPNMSSPASTTPSAVISAHLGWTAQPEKANLSRISMFSPHTPHPSSFHLVL